MGLFDFFSRKASAVGKILVMNPGQPRWAPRNYASFAKEGYSQNVVAYQAVNRIADAVASIEWETWLGDDVVETDNPLKQLWARPNPQQATGEYLRSVVGYLLISGNSYLESVTVAGRPVELWSLRPDRMQVIPGQAGMPQGYVFSKDGKKVRWDVDELTGRGDIKHLRLFNPLDDWYGMSPIEAGAYAIDQHNESMKWLQALLQNSARPSGALVMKGETNLGDEQYNRLKAQIEENYVGAGNAGRPMLLEGGLDWKSMSFAPKDMMLMDTKFSAARDVSLAFGVPPQLLNIPGDNTYSNYKEARLAFYEDTVLPLVGFLLDELNPWFEPLFGGMRLEPNLDAIPAIAEKRMDLWKMADTAVDLTIDERRALKGYPPLSEVAPGEDGRRLLQIGQDQEPTLDDAQVTEAAKAVLYKVAYGQD